MANEYLTCRTIMITGVIRGLDRVLAEWFTVLGGRPALRHQVGHQGPDPGSGS